ncbi:hypothetical protein DV736_g2543, partial [Chaetothyriales sp. CBS 134916]
MTNFKVESYIWLSVVVCIVIGRFIARIWHFKSVKQLQIEDGLMLFLTCLYIILIIFLNIDLTVSTNLIDPEHPVELTPKEIKKRTWGSKTVLLVEQCMCAIQWGTKACLLFLYWRLTQNLTQAYAVKAVTAYVAITYIVMIILYFAVWCQPFHDYWATPSDNPQCTTALHHLITNLVFNVTSDILIMSITLPLFIRAKLEFKRKLLLVFPFALGFFTIICAVLSKHASFTKPYSSEWVFWYCREASTAMIVANMPYTWALIKRAFKLKSFFGTSSDRSERGHMQELHGHSLGDLSAKNLRQEGAATSKSDSGKQKLDLSWHKPMSKQKSTSTDEDTIFEEGGSSAIPSRDLKTGFVDISAPASGSHSATASVRNPAKTSSTTDALDKLYRLGDDDWELQGPQVTTKQRRRVQPPQSSPRADVESQSPSELVLEGFAEERRQHGPDAGHLPDETNPRRRRHRLQRSQDGHGLAFSALQEPRLTHVTPTHSDPATYTTWGRQDTPRTHSSVPPMIPTRPVRVLVASIGNPGPYLTTRHSAGHILNKLLASHLNFPFFQKSKLYSGSISSGNDVGRPELTLWQSNNMMNESGIGLLKAWRAFTHFPSDAITGLVVLHDELETASGVLKVRRGPEASARGHNGIKSVLSTLRGAAVLPELGDKFIRIGVGIGRPMSRERDDVSAYVLGQVTKGEKDGIQERVGDVEKLLQNEIMRISSG